MSRSNPAKFVDVVDLRTLRRTLKGIKSGEADCRTEVVETVEQLFLNDNELRPRSEIRDQLNEADVELVDTIENLVTKSYKEEILEGLDADNLLSHISGHTSTSIEILSEELSLREIEYLQSHFKFVDRSTDLYSFKFQGEILENISNQASNSGEAQRILLDELKTLDNSHFFKNAAGTLPAPLVGNVDYDPKPRLVHFEDKDHLYMEFWSLGGTNPIYDVNRGDYINIDEREKTAAKVHLDSQTIEAVSTKASDEDHLNNIANRILELFETTEEYQTDGGNLQSLISQQNTDLYTSVSISDDDIDAAHDHIGIMSTLVSFRGSNNNYRATSREDSEVTTEDIVDELAAGRDYKRSHVQVLIAADDPMDQYSLVYPDEVEDLVDINDDMTIHEIVEEFRDESTYAQVRKFTVVLNTDKDTIRVWKSQCSPRTRRLVFHAFASELGW